MRKCVFTYREYCEIQRKPMQYVIDEYGPDGFSAVTPAGNRIIVYHEQRTPGRIRWTLAHEFAHHFLGHLDQSCETAERDADTLAAIIVSGGHANVKRRTCMGAG